MNHTDNLILRTSSCSDGSAVVGSVMRLHDPGVVDTEGGCADANTTVGFLDDDGEDETAVYTGGFGFGDNAVVDGLDLVRGVLLDSGCAALCETIFVQVPAGELVSCDQEWGVWNTNRVSKVSHLSIVGQVLPSPE